LLCFRWPSYLGCISNKQVDAHLLKVNSMRVFGSLHMTVNEHGEIWAWTLTSTNGHDQCIVMCWAKPKAQSPPKPSPAQPSPAHQQAWIRLGLGFKNIIIPVCKIIISIDNVSHSIHVQSG
jgi:hypothetical protein